MASLDDMMKDAETAIETGGDLSEVQSDTRGKKDNRVNQKKSVSDQIKEKKMTEGEESEEVLADGTKKVSKKKSKTKVRSKKYQEVSTQVEKNKKYNIEDSIELVKKTSFTKFDGNVEVHIRVQSKSGKPEILRGLVQYPFSTGKSVKVVIMTEEMIEEILKTKKLDFDIVLCTPAMMPKVSRLAKILGPKGKMPNPKAGTVTMDPEKTKAELEGGKTEYRSDSYGIIHQIIGKVSYKSEELIENYKSLISLLPKEKINSINLSSTMGPGIKVSK